MNNSKLSRAFLRENYLHLGRPKGAVEFLGSDELDVDASTLFEVLSNTSKINKAIGLSKRYESENEGKKIVTTKVLGKEAQWEEHPWQWEWGKFMVSRRKYLKGPLKEEYSVIYIQQLENGSRCRYYFYYLSTPKNLAVKLVYKFGFPHVFKQMKESIQGLCVGAEMNARPSKQYLSKELIKQKLSGTCVSEDIVDKMSELVAFSEDDELDKIQLPRLERDWRTSLNELLDAFLIASKKGVTKLNWEVLCPHCQGSRFTTHNLDKLLTEYSCEACRIEFSLTNINLIDTVFTVDQELRPIQSYNYCAGEPHRKPHILLALRLSPGQRFQPLIELNVGSYRLRTLELPGSAEVEVAPGAGETLNWDVSSSVLNMRCSPDAELFLTNSSQESVFLILEKVQKPQFYLSPLKVFNSKHFKNHYSEQKLGSGVQLALPEQVIVFSDIVGSTEFYSKNGDINAYKQVRKHFEILEETVEELNGVVIKTIGDAVMFTLLSESDYFLALKTINERIAQSGDIGFRLRYSIHSGPVIGVNHNKGIDYFGAIVNECAKLQAIADGDEVAMSEKLAKQITRLHPDLKLSERKYLGKKTGLVAKL